MSDFEKWAAHGLAILRNELAILRTGSWSLQNKSKMCEMERRELGPQMRNGRGEETVKIVPDFAK